MEIFAIYGKKISEKFFGIISKILIFFNKKNVKFTLISKKQNHETE